MKKQKLMYVFSTIFIFVVSLIFILSFPNIKAYKKDIYKAQLNKNKISKTFLKNTIDYEEIKKTILQIPSPNYYEQKGYKLNTKFITIAKDEKKQIELLDPNNKKVEDVQYFAKTYYPLTQVYSVNDSLENQFFKFNNNGQIIGQSNNKENPLAEIWAYHNGHLYRAVLQGVHDEFLDKRFEEQINKEVESVIEQLELRKKTDVEKVISVANYIADNLTWINNAFDQTLYSAVINKITVCTGYGKMFQKFMNELGIPSRTVEGKSDIQKDTYHVWNMVELDGEWYHVDTTYKDNDPDGDWYMFVGDDDFLVSPNHRSFTSYNKTGKNYKIYLYKKTNTFANNLEEVEEISNYKYHNLFLGKQKNNTQFTFTANKKLNYDDVIEKVKNTFKNYGIKANIFMKDTYKHDFDLYTFNLEDIPALDRQKTTFEIKSIEKVNANEDEIMDHIKITLDQKIELKTYNFKARFSLIDKVLTNDNKTYEIYLKNPENKGNYKEEITINKQYYTYNPFINTKVDLNVKTIETPTPKINVLNKEKVLITNVDENTIYRLGGILRKWKKADSNTILLNNLGNKTIEFRKIDPKLNLKSDIIKLEIKMGIDPIVKQHNNEIVGVDETMEYKKEKEKYWKRITGKTLNNLENAKYIIRRAQTDKELPSNEITIQFTRSEN